jgi:hypothetical protein
LRADSEIHLREKLRAGISFVQCVSRKPALCAKFLQRVIGTLGGEKLRDFFYGFFCDGLLIQCLSIVKYPSRSERKKTLYKLIVAFHDMVYARAACELFGENVDSIFHPLYQPLLHSIAICYSKPFVENKALGPLSGHWRKFEDRKYQETHEKLLNIRNEIIAHNDLETVKVMMVPPGSSFKGRKHGGLGLGYALSTYAFPLEKFEVIWHTIEEQRVRLMKAIDEEILVLYGLSQIPEVPFRLDFTEGL